MIKNVKLLNILLRTIEQNNGLPDHPFFYKTIGMPVLVSIIVCVGFLHLSVVIEVCVTFRCCKTLNIEA